MWYSYLTITCPVCGKSRTIKQLVKDKPKPKNWLARHKIEYCYDYCEG